MIAETKAISDTRIHQHARTDSLMPTEYLTSGCSKYYLQCRSDNYISCRDEKSSEFTVDILPKSSSKENQLKTLYTRLINEHFPIVTINNESQTVTRVPSFESPSVPKQAETFLHRFIKTIFSITQQSSTKKNSSTKRNRIGLRTKNLSDTSDLCVKLSTKQKRIKRKTKPNAKIAQQQCIVCRQNRSSLSKRARERKTTEPLDVTNQSLDTIDVHSQSIEPNSSTKTFQDSIKFQKQRSLTDAQRKLLISNIESIFDILVSKY